MKKRKQHTTWLMALVFIVMGWMSSCVSPEQIETLTQDDWNVFGMVGEERAPVIFVYKVTANAFFKYDVSATVYLLDRNTGLEIPLVPVIAQDELTYNVNEFPFGEDINGNIIYFTTPGGFTLTGNAYRVSIDTDDGKASAEIQLPEPAGFSNVELARESNIGTEQVTRLHMSIEDLPQSNLYKWEIAVESQFLVNEPVDFDPISGEPVSFQQVEPVFVDEITPNNYIDEEKIAERENDFTYNLTSNIPDYPYTEETYLLHVRLRTYSDALVEYFTSIEDQQSGAIFDPFYEPVFIRSNIEGLPGVIGTFAYSQDYVFEYIP